MKDYKPGTVLFSGPDDDESIAEAKQYCADNMLTKDDVKLVRMTVHLEQDVSAKIIAVIKK